MRAPAVRGQRITTPADSDPQPFAAIGLTPQGRGIIIIFIFLDHQHKAAGRKTRLDIQKLWLQRQFTL